MRAISRPAQSALAVALIGAAGAAGAAAAAGGISGAAEATGVPIIVSIRYLPYIAAWSDDPRAQVTTTSGASPRNRSPSAVITASPKGAALDRKVRLAKTFRSTGGTLSRRRGVPLTTVQP